MSQVMLSRARTGAVVLCATVAALVAGCGGGTRTSGDTTNATAFGQAVNLRPGDVPDTTAVRPIARELSEPPWGERVDRCGARVGRTGEFVAIRSPRFRSKLRQRDTTVSLPRHITAISSAVYVTPSASFASRDLAAAARAVSSGCVARSFAEGVRSPFRQGHATIAPLPAPAPGIPAYGLRLASIERGSAGILHGPGGAVHGYTDTFGFVAGRAEVLLTAVGLDRPVGSDTERRLLSLLYQRARQLQPVLAGKRALVIE
jgi:hypothetical protein